MGAYVLPTLRAELVLLNFLCETTLSRFSSARAQRRATTTLSRFSSARRRRRARGPSGRFDAEPPSPSRSLPLSVDGRYDSFQLAHNVGGALNATDPEQAA